MPLVSWGLGHLKKIDNDSRNNIGQKQKAATADFYYWRGGVKESSWIFVIAYFIAVMKKGDDVFVQKKKSRKFHRAVVALEGVFRGVRSSMSWIGMASATGGLVLLPLPFHVTANGPKAPPKSLQTASHSTYGVQSSSANSSAVTWQAKWSYHCRLLSQFHTLQAIVVQQNPRGDRQQGMLYIRRPGQMRLVYQRPCLLDMMATGNRLMLYDGQRKHTQSMSLQKTPLSFLLSGRIEDQVSVQRVLCHAPYMTWVVTWNKNPQGGTIHLTFKDVNVPLSRHNSPPASKTTPEWTLTGWTMIDPQGNTTAVQLNRVTVNQTLPAEAFKTEAY